jgi:DnaK suppressor protein
MASKKPATKARKGAATARPAARKPVTPKGDARKAAVAGKRQAVARQPARPARAAGPAKVAKKPAAATAVRSDGDKATPAVRAARPSTPGSGPVPPLAPRPGAAPESRPGARPAMRDELEGVEASSLLAGPRNVKPYVPKRGEQYMGKQQLKHFQEILLNWKRDLMMEVDRTVTHMKDEAANFPDPNDRATQEEEFSLELRTRDRERKLIRKIDEALKRAEDGTYGYCLETGEEIGIKRLEARPVATLCLEAQERRERRERQYGDRDDRYR